MSYLQFLGRLILTPKENQHANGISMLTFPSAIFKVPQAHNFFIGIFHTVMINLPDSIENTSVKKGFLKTSKRQTCILPSA